MKHLASLLLLSVFLFHYSCSSQDDEWGGGEQQKNQNGTKSIGLSFSKATLEAFDASGITELEVYAYLGDSLVYGRNLPLNDGDLEIEVPLGESLKTFAVANASMVSDSDSLSTVTIHQDTKSQREIFVSDIVTFMSDRSVDKVNLELKRMVGQAVLKPTETEAELAAFTKFDELNVVFNNVVVGYMPGAKKYILGSAMVEARIADGYSASVYSFPTPGEDFGSVEVIYLKAGTEVNRTSRPLDVAIQYTASKRTVINMPVLDDDYLQTDFSALRRMGVKTSGGISVQEYQF